MLIVQGADGRPMVSRAWEGKTVVCIASGTSLTKEQVDAVCAAHAAGALKTIVVNDNYLIAPWADALYFADARWWQWHSDGLEKSWPWVKFSAAEVKQAMAGFKGQKISIDHPNKVGDKAVLRLANAGNVGLSEDPYGIKTGSNSGYQAVNIAALSGAKKILLLGYDMKHQHGRAHAHNGHPVKSGEGIYRGYAKHFSTMETPLKNLGIEVFNCTLGSEIGAFPYAPLERVLGPHGAPVLEIPDVSKYNGFLPLWTQVSENLWFGGSPEADPERYGRFKYIVDCVGNGFKYKRGDAALLSAPFPDSDPPPDLALVNAMADLAIAGMRRGFTLIHCQQGHNRSALIAAAALVRAGLCAKQDVVNFLRQKRKPEVLTNPAFVKMIHEAM
jgi:hypothetical protein